MESTTTAKKGTRRSTPASPCRFMPPEFGKAVSLRGMRITPKAVGADTGRGLTVLEIVAPPRTGSPNHVCRFEDKVFYVVEGTFRFRIDDQEVNAPPGTSVLVPRRAAHGFTSVGPGDGRLLVMLTPAGHERFLAGLAKLEAGGNQDPDRMMDLCDTYGVELL